MKCETPSCQNERLMLPGATRCALCVEKIEDVNAVLAAQGAIHLRLMLDLMGVQAPALPANPDAPMILTAKEVGLISNLLMHIDTSTVQGQLEDYELEEYADVIPGLQPKLDRLGFAVDLVDELAIMRENHEEEE